MQWPAVRSHALAPGPAELEGSMRVPVQVEPARNRPTAAYALLAPLALSSSSVLGGGAATAEARSIRGIRAEDAAAGLPQPPKNRCVTGTGKKHLGHSPILCKVYITSPITVPRFQVQVLVKSAIQPCQRKTPIRFAF